MPSKITLRQRLRLVAGNPHQIEQHGRQRRVDALVRSDLAIPEVEECLPVDEAARCTLAATQIVRIGRRGGCWVVNEDEPEELVTIERAEVGPVARANLRMPEP